MKITTEQSIANFDFWSGAKANAAELTLSQLNEVESILEDLYPDGINETQLNDIFWFDFETVKEWLGITDDEDDEDDEDE